jgi:hypothetical protein
VHEARPASGLWDGLCGGDKRWRGGWQRAILGRAGHSKAVRTLPVGEVRGGEDPQGGGGTRGGCGRCNTRQEHREAVITDGGWN